jgi:SET domain-containing protein
MASPLDKINNSEINVIDYLDSNIWVRLSNTKYGVGVIALRDIPKNTKITDYDYCQFQNLSIKFFFIDYHDFITDINKLHPNIQNLIKDRCIFHGSGGGYFLSPNSHQIYRLYINHSENPNIDNNLVSIKDINEGEEITFSYKNIISNDTHIVSKKYYNYVA